MMFLLVSISLIGISCITYFSTKNYEAYDHAFTTLNYSLPSLWIVTDVKSSKEPFYDTYLVEQTVLDHFKNNLSTYISTIKVGFFYFDSKTYLEDLNRYVTGVRISLNAKIPFKEEYYRAMTYTIQRNEL